MTTQRFVSLHGFFAVAYPSAWTQETDEHGHYLFYNTNGGSGVARIMVLENEFTGENADAKLMEEVYNRHHDFEPQLLVAGVNRFVHYQKVHDVNGTPFSVSYWVTAKQDKVVLITFTIQSSMKEMDVAIAEKREIEQMVASFTFLHDTVHHG
ncbi:MAG: DUF3805 domain-containing protein [Bacteroidia bacterium]|jgi:hypothetical protein|nr:DUF3805 domain-containing protein [Bacteroidia bacterium]